MQHQDGSKLLELVRDRVLPATSGYLEFVEFRECFVVVS